MLAVAAHSSPIWSNPEILGGTPVFRGTRVPARIMFEYLETGDSLDVFLDEFPTVEKQQAVLALQLAAQSFKTINIAR